MEKEKRYVLTIDLYIYAYDSEEAKIKVKDVIKKINNISGEFEASKVSLIEQNFGTIGNRKVS